MSIKHLIFDADDTLWYTTILYQTAKRKFSLLMQEQGISPEEALKTLTQIDIAQVKVHGFKRCRFPGSMVLTYKQMVPNPKPAIEKEVYSIGDSVFAQPTKNIPQVETALAQLKPHYDMVLVTKGDHEIQHWRLTQSGLKDFFEAVHVVDHKDVPLYKQIIEHHKFEPAATCSIGDSLKSDILTAMAVGTAGIWIPNNNWADFEHAEPPTDQPHFKQIPHLTQLRSTLENW